MIHFLFFSHYLGESNFFSFFVFFSPLFLDLNHFPSFSSHFETQGLTVAPVSQSSHLTTSAFGEKGTTFALLFLPGTDEESWERLYKFCFQLPFEPKKFKQLFGVSTHISDMIWGILQRSIPPPEFLEFEPKHLLWALYHLKNYGAADFKDFGVSCKTFRHWTWKIIKALYAFVNDVSLKCNSLVVFKNKNFFLPLMVRLP